MRLRQVICGALLATFVGLGAVAQAQPDEPGLRARIRERVRMAIEQKLIAALSLDPGTAAKLTAVLDRFDSQIAELQKANGQSFRELKQFLDGGGGDATTINGFADRILDNRARIQRLEVDRSREVRHVLTPQQYGRLIIAYPQVTKDLKKEMWKAMAEKRGNRPGAPPGPEPDIE